MGDNIVTWQLHIARQKKKERNVFPVILTSGIVWRVKLYDHNTQKQTSKETEINGWTDKRTSSVITPNIANEMKDYKLANLQQKWNVRSFNLLWHKKDCSIQSTI